MIIDPFSMLLAIIPLVSYFGLIAAVRLSGRHLMTTGSRDMTALSLATGGLVAVGPAQLFFPNTAAMVFGPKVWLAIALLYFLVVTFITLLMRPSLTVYGRTPSEMFPPLLRACHRIDDSTIGDEKSLEVHLKKVGLRLRCEGVADQDTARIVSFAPAFGPSFWNKLLAELRREDIPISPQRSVGGAWAMLLSVTGLIVVVTYGLTQPTEVVAEFRDWLWR